MSSIKSCVIQTQSQGRHGHQQGRLARRIDPAHRNAHDEGGGRYARFAHAALAASAHRRRSSLCEHAALRAILKRQAFTWS